MALCKCGCGRELAGKGQKKFAAPECAPRFSRKVISGRMQGNQFACKKKRVPEMLPEINGTIPIKNLRLLAVAILSDVVKTIRSRKTPDYIPNDWKKDLNWLHSSYSNYHLWCDIMDVDTRLLRERFPK